MGRIRRCGSLAPTPHKEASILLSTWTSSPLHSGCRGIDSNDSIPPLRSRGRTGVFLRQRHQSSSVVDPLRAASALLLGLSICTDFSTVQPADPMGTGSALPTSSTCQTFSFSTVRGEYLFRGSRTRVPDCDKVPYQDRIVLSDTIRYQYREIDCFRTAGRVFPVAIKLGEDDRRFKKHHLEKSEHTEYGTVLYAGRGRTPFLVFSKIRSLESGVWLSVVSFDRPRPVEVTTTVTLVDRRSSTPDDPMNP